MEELHRHNETVLQFRCRLYEYAITAAHFPHSVRFGIRDGVQVGPTAAALRVSAHRTAQRCILPS